ncbi:endogenous retrovirus group K member 8 Gag polyprotein-like [Dasypus novemcinctus]|uniref:endogenous retrovirus group K member 8 Gag polyprotein-like n=1 Tax=Dasypus novemcinctus TaxID=9361 RepID=UPI00265E120F|nr:endogenous retrovirus group K member 10 Gag polyprotein-like [Dasypus novemcinctus]
MGQGTSQHSLYMKQLKEALKARGTRVKKKDLTRFFEFLLKTCPWFPRECTIDDKCWTRVGDCLQDYYKTFGPEKVPVTAFSYWNLISETLKVHFSASDIQELCKKGEEALKEHSRSTSACSSVIIDMPAESPPDKNSTESRPNTPISQASMPPDQIEIEPEIKILPPFENLETKPKAKIPSRSKINSLPPFRPPPYNPEFPNPYSQYYPAASLPQVYALERMTKNLRLHANRFKETIDQERQLAAGLLAELQSVTQTIAALALPENAHLPRSHFAHHTYAFPVTRSRDRSLAATSQDGAATSQDGAASSQNGTANSQDGAANSQNGANSQNSESEEDPPCSDEGEKEEVSTTRREREEGCTTTTAKYKTLSLKYLEKLKKAVNDYGATAPFTLTLLESLSEKKLIPNDWFQLARAALSSGDFLLWKSDYEEHCKKYATCNARKTTSKKWTLNKFLGQSPYHQNDKQAQFPRGLIAQIQTAALRAWKKLPQKGAATASLAKLRQGPDETYTDFLSRLQNMAEHLFGASESDSDFIKHLAFENANDACQAVIRPFCNTDLNNYIKLCSGIGPTQTLGIAIGAALQNFAAQTKPPTCFNCKQPGHFSKNCPVPKVNSSLSISKNSSLSSSICPRCKKGFHWASDCHSRTDINGQLLKPKPQGKVQWGRPQAPTRTNPGAIRFVQPSPVAVPALPTINHAAVSQTYGGPQQGAQEWTSVLPPNQY